MRNGESILRLAQHLLRGVSMHSQPERARRNGALAGRLVVATFDRIAALQLKTTSCSLTIIDLCKPDHGRRGHAASRVLHRAADGER